jgi:hypothetical protein
MQLGLNPLDQHLYNLFLFSYYLSHFTLCHLCFLLKLFHAAFIELHLFVNLYFLYRLASYLSKFWLPHLLNQQFHFDQEYLDFLRFNHALHLMELKDLFLSFLYSCLGIFKNDYHHLRHQLLPNHV